MLIRKVFFSDEGRLRSGWRAGFFVALYSVVLALFAAFAYTVIGSTVGLPEASSAKFLIATLVSLVPALLVGWVCGYLFEGLPFRALGASFTGRWLVHLLLGLLVGGAGLTLAVTIAALFGNYNFEIAPNLDLQLTGQALAWSFAVFAVGAAFEEALFRGYAFQTLVRARLAWLAVLSTAVVFGSAHLRNDGAGTISTFDTALAGVVFAAAYLRSRDLWFPTGIHLMWNWVQGSIFGIEVSGISDLSAQSVLNEVDHGPEWLTGGVYGIEGGIASTIALLVTLAAIYFMPLVKPAELAEIRNQEQTKASEF